MESPHSTESMYLDGLNMIPESPNTFGHSSNSSSPLQHPQPPTQQQQQQQQTVILTAMQSRQALDPSPSVKLEPGLHSRGPPALNGPPIKSEQGGPPTYVIDRDLSVQGVVVAQSFMQHSDLRYKTNVEDLLDAMEIVKNLSGKRYEWKKDKVESTSNENTDEKGGKKVIGLIAQEVQQIVPGAVQEAPNGYLSVDYTQLMPVLIEAFKTHIKART